MKKLLLLIISFASTVCFAQDTTFKPSGKIWGYVFGDYAYKLHADSLSRGNNQYSQLPEGYSSFDMRRVYFGYDYKISPNLSTEFLLAHENSTDLTVSSNRTVYIKAANVKWKLKNYNAVLVMGQMATPAWSFIPEKVWDHRAVEKTIGDFRKISISNDVGAALQGKFSATSESGYNIMVGNGTGPKIETSRFNKIYGNVYFKFLNNRLILDLFSDYKITELIPSHHKSKLTFKAFLAWQSEKITIGLEGFTQFQRNNITFENSDSLTRYEDILPIGLSFFVHGPIIKNKISWFARWDTYDENINFSEDRNYTKAYNPLEENFFTAGIRYQPYQNIYIIPNAWMNTYKNKIDPKPNYDLALRVTVHFIFK